MKKYQPINCNFYDVLESYATLRKPITLKFRDEAGDAQERQGVVIMDFETKNKEEFLVAKDGWRLRLDQVLAVWE